MNRKFLPIVLPLCFAVVLWLFGAPVARAQGETTQPLTATQGIATPSVITVSEELNTNAASVLATGAYTVSQDHTDPCMSPCSVIFEASASADWKISNNGVETRVSGRQRFVYLFEGPPVFYSFQYEATFPKGPTIKGLPFMLQMIKSPTFEQAEYTCLSDTACRLSLKFDAPPAVGPYTVEVLGATYLQSQFMDPQRLNVLVNPGIAPERINVTVIFGLPPYTRVSVTTRINVVKVQVVLSMPIIRTAPVVAGQ